MLKLFDDEAHSHSVTVTGSQGWKSRLSGTGLSKTAFRPSPGRSTAGLRHFPIFALRVLSESCGLVSKHLSFVVRSKGSEVGDGDGG